MKTGYAIIVAGFFVGAAIMFAGAGITQAINSNYGGDGFGGGLVFSIAGVLGLILHLTALKAKKNQQQSPLVGKP